MNTSDLSDDDLMILDAMFDARVGKNALHSQNYPTMFNTPYSHGLVGSLLDSSLSRLLGRGLVDITTTDGGPWYGLTVDGGTLWEGERAPDWDRYCVAFEDETPAGATSVEVIAFSRQTGEEFLEVMKRCGVYPDVPIQLPA